LGTLQLHLSGGEPLARADLTDLVAGARAGGLYVNLITSGVGLSSELLSRLVAAGLDHLQLSMQDVEESLANDIAGTRSHALKLEVARMVRQQPIAFTLNVVVHRQNLDRLEQVIAMAERLGTDRLEIANVQYYGWAVRNRDRLLPTREQLERSLEVVERARERLKGSMRIDYVVPDYYARYPKACMGGWGQRLMLIDPAGFVLPCHAARTIPGLDFGNVRESPLGWIWNESPAFRRFRGEDWMQEPCRTCERREIDFGGCRCQALLLAQDANATDPVCSLAPTHGIVRDILERVNTQANPVASGWVYRIDPR